MRFNTNAEPPKTQPPRKRSGPKDRLKIKRWKAGYKVKSPADGVSLTIEVNRLVNLSGPKGQLEAQDAAIAAKCTYV